MLAFLLLLPVQTIRIAHDPKHLLNTFIAQEALGVGIDGHQAGDIEKLFAPANLDAMKSVGFRSLSFRLRTELAAEAWHWNPNGHWSGQNEGYWTSSQTGPIKVSNGFRLPRRGSTGDEANDDGYSRLDDGDPSTFWKSNPYLSQPFTHESDSKHPQQIVIDLGKVKPIDRTRIQWAAPFARDFLVQYWFGENTPGESEGHWQTFERGAFHDAKGSDQAIVLSRKPVDARFLRVRMMRSSNTSQKPSKDVRDWCGYAIREVSFGVKDHDEIRHGKHGHQTTIFASSTDPWHRAEDFDPNTEHVGFDRLVETELNAGQPILFPVSTLYDDPQEAAGMVRYLKSRHIPIRGIELGEEPDGQFVEPDDFAALSIQVANAIRQVDPHIAIGGPSLEEIQSEVEEFPCPPQRPWLTRFVEGLRRRGKQSLFQFASFEWYPYDSLNEPAPVQLQEMSNRFRQAYSRLKLPRAFPVFVTEYGWSAFAAQPEVDLDGGLMDADIVGTSLALGFRTAYLYGLEPTQLAQDSERNGWGDNALFLTDPEGSIRYRTARFWVARLMTGAWTSPPATKWRLYDVRNAGSVRTFPLRDRLGNWSIMILNEDPAHEQSINLEGVGKQFRASQFGRKQYEWRAAGPNGAPIRSLPPEQFDTTNQLTLPPYSITVLRSR